LVGAALADEPGSSKALHEGVIGCDRQGGATVADESAAKHQRAVLIGHAVTVLIEPVTHVGLSIERGTHTCAVRTDVRARARVAVIAVFALLRGEGARPRLAGVLCARVVVIADDAHAGLAHAPILLIGGVRLGAVSV